MRYECGLLVEALKLTYKQLFPREFIIINVKKKLCSVSRPMDLEGKERKLVIFTVLSK